MQRYSVLICFIILSVHIFGQNINQNVNNNAVIIQNQPVIEREKYIIQYRTVYVDKPQPKRYARKLSAPICLQGYLWVYPEDLGTYVNGPSDIIYQINRQGKYGRNDWRVPSPDELRLMENYANECGLGDDIYLATDHRNGVLRLVSTGLSIREQEQVAQQNRAEELRRQQEAANAATAQHQAHIAEQNSLIYSGEVIQVGNVLWATKNKGANNTYDKGVMYNTIQLTGDWRLPTENEFNNMLRQATKSTNAFVLSNGLVIPFGMYAIKRTDGTIGYITLPDRIAGNSNASKLYRLVQDKIYK